MYVVMVERPAEGKAGNFLDWIAGGLEMNLVFIFFAVSLWSYVWFCTKVRMVLL